MFQYTYLAPAPKKEWFKKLWLEVMEHDLQHFFPAPDKVLEIDRFSLVFI